MLTPQELRAQGASRSLRKTIGELEEFLAGTGIFRPTGELRRRFHRLLRDYGEHWYRRGFARGIKTLRKRDQRAVDKLLPVQATVKVRLIGQPGPTRRIQMRHD